MRNLPVVFVLSGLIFAASGSSAAADEVCVDTVAAYEVAVAEASTAIGSLKAEVAALKEQIALERQRTEIIEKSAAVMVASYERELAAARRELGASRWRRLLDSLIVAGAGFTVGAAVGD